MAHTHPVKEFLFFLYYHLSVSFLMRYKCGTTFYLGRASGYPFRWPTLQLIFSCFYPPTPPSCYFNFAIFKRSRFVVHLSKASFLFFSISFGYSLDFLLMDKGSFLCCRSVSNGLSVLPSVFGGLLVLPSVFWQHFGVAKCFPRSWISVVVFSPLAHVDSLTTIYRINSIKNEFMG